MLLKNMREPFDMKGPFDPESETGANWIEYYKRHGYVEYIDMPAIIGDDVGVTVTSKRGKKAEQPPADLGKLAEYISKTEGEA